VTKLFSGFFGRFAANFGVTARAQAAGNFIANAHPGGRFGLEQRLPIGIYGDKFDAL
jgi:hypothetical protein